MRAIETCTKISRTLDEILERFERGDLKPIRAARRRPKRPANKKAQSKPAVKKSRKAVAGKAPVKKSEPRAVKAA
jgi:TAG lipase/steryl ester hydrolase/phospholipase A2/LPA acyltransferase